MPYPVGVPPSIRSTPSAGDTNGEEEVFVEEVADCLGLPVGMLIRRIEAGTVPGRRLDGPDGIRYRVVVPRSVLGYSASRPPAGGRPADGQDRGPGPTASPPPGQPADDDGDTPEWSLHGRAVSPAAMASSAPVATVPLVRLEEVGFPNVELARAPHGGGVDARELVAALLARWERSHEQRIDAEARLRWEPPLAQERARNRTRAAELEAARTEIAALIAERDDARREAERCILDLRTQLEEAIASSTDRAERIADRERAISARDRILDELRRDATARDREIANLRLRLEAEAARPEPAPRRGLFGR